MTVAANSRTIRSAILSAAVAIVVLLAHTTVASATYDPISAGATVMKLDRGFSKLLKKNHVRLIGFKQGKVKGKKVSLPISNGKLDPTTTEGTIKHDGGFSFKAGSKKVLVKSVILKTTQRHSPLSAKVGGGQLKLGTSPPPVFDRKGFDNTVTVNRLKISQKFAQRLNKKLKLKDVFAAGQLIGTAVTTAIPSTTAVGASGKFQLDMNPALVEKLNKLSVPINPISPAEKAGAGFTMPIIGGTVAPNAAGGEVLAGGSLEMLQLGGGQLIWHEWGANLEANTVSAEVEFGPSPPHPGKQGRLSLFDLTGGQRTPDPGARTVAVLGATLALQASTAQAMNEAFAGGEATFQAGEAFATLSFTAQGQ